MYWCVTGNQSIADSEGRRIAIKDRTSAAVGIVPPPPDDRNPFSLTDSEAKIASKIVKQ